MRRVSSVGAALLLVAIAAGASADSPSERRLRDLVRVADGLFQYDDLAVCQLRLPGSESPKFQIRSQAQAPSKGVISRDQFVAMITQYELVIGLGLAQARPGVTPVQAAEALHCTPIAAAFGTPDLELRLTITAEGSQLEVTDTATGKKSRSVQTWDEASE
jgi:hypothetical protein